MNSENAYDLFLEAKNCTAKKEYLKAIMLLEKAVKIEPGKNSIREALALCYFNNGLHEAAKTQFNKMLEIDASNDFAHFGLGMCLVKEGSISLALGHFKIANAMKPAEKIYIDKIKKYNRISGISHKMRHQ